MFKYQHRHISKWESLENFDKESGQNSIKKDKGPGKFQQIIESPENFYLKN